MVVGVNRSGWKRRIERTETTYWRALRSHVGRYAASGVALPESFHSPIRSVAFLCADGVVLARYLAKERDSVEVHDAAENTIRVVARDFVGSDVSLSAPWSRRWFAELSNIRMHVRPENGDSVLTFRPDWEALLVARGFSPRLWSEDRARERARWDVLAYVAAPLLDVDLDRSADTLVTPREEVLAKFESVVDEFALLLATADREAPLQRFLEHHPELLSLEAASVRPQFRFGDDYIADFVLELAAQEYVLVEIEAATRALYTQKQDPAAALTHAIQQVQDWQEWFVRAGSYASEKLPGVIDPECWVIIGRRLADGPLRHKWQRHQRNLKRAGIHLLTYDDLLDRARRQIGALRRLGEG